MKNRVLYFPYIRVPQSTWLTQMLLYWDQVSSIVPYDFIQQPDALGTYMRSLVEQGLVFQVIPGAYVYQIPNFARGFESYIDSLGPDTGRRRARFAGGHTFKIHIEKMEQIAGPLVDQRLARQGHYPWYEVEADTANDFMSYLASALGQLQSVDSSPVTDDPAYLGRFANAGVPEDRIVQQLQSLRIQVLERVLPVPNHSVDPVAIRAFKDRHAQLLGDFRRRVERELVAAAAITDHALRQRQLDIFFEEAAARIAEIQAAMHRAQWNTIKGALSVLAAIPGFPQIFGLVAAVCDAFSEDRGQALQDFAYAAYAGAEL